MKLSAVKVEKVVRAPKKPVMTKRDIAVGKWAALCTQAIAIPIENVPMPLAAKVPTANTQAVS